jgi:hypothetical protein
MRSPYRHHEDVKFKQVDLQNKLLRLFIDMGCTPADDYAIKLLEHLEKPHESEQFAFQIKNEPGGPRPELTNGSIPSKTKSINGTAELLLHPFGQNTLRRVVLEGAPRQGKSTISQYTCQIHRINRLNMPIPRQQLPESLRAVPSRIPFKVDLRDLGAWMAGRNPFVPSDISRPANWTPSLEAFLAAQASHFSGGVKFSTADFLNMVNEEPMLLVLDGLDEIADVKLKASIVSASSEAMERLDVRDRSLQLIVTSRPTAFMRAAHFPRDSYIYLVLFAVGKVEALDYGQRWSAIRVAADHERQQDKNPVAAQMEEPHIRGLARSPMQLAILLALIYTRGHSLSDKRTALYSSYMDLFLDRESEKSDIVRQHRDLLLNIHGYVAWLLHCEAEDGQGRGSIELDRLREVVSAYLARHGHPTELASYLLSGVIDRVVALVSRVQNTFEFEV